LKVLSWRPMLAPLPKYFSSPWSIAFLSTCLVLIGMAVLDWAFPNGGSLWNGLITEHETLVYFCEPTVIEALFRQKVDTYSNVGFFFLGILVLAYAWQDHGNTSGGFATSVRSWSYFYGIALLTTFAGSTFFHASLTRIGEATDLAGVYAAVLMPGFFNLHRVACFLKQRRLPSWPFLAVWAVVWIVCSLLIFRLSSRVVAPSGLLLIGLSGFFLFLKVKPRKGWGFAASSVVMTFVAATFFVFDIQKTGCEPNSIWQAHSIWHLLAACAAGLYYGFMRRLS
jgi:hypothetical protein